MVGVEATGTNGGEVSGGDEGILMTLVGVGEDWSGCR